MVAIGAAVLLVGLMDEGSSSIGATPVSRFCDRVASPSGSDRNSGTGRRPFASPQRLAASLKPGQTGCLRGGTYSTDEVFVLDIERGGTRGARITIRSHPGERARLHGIVQVEHGADFITLSRLSFEGTGDQNTIKIYAADVVVERSDITNGFRGNSCMILGSNDGAGQAVRTIVTRNRFRECGDPDNDNKDHAIYAANLSGGRILGNLFYNHMARAVQLYPNSRNTRVAYNVIDGGPPSIRGGIVIGGDDEYASSGNVVEQNIITHSETYGVYSNFDEKVGGGNVVRLNCLWAARLANTDFVDGGVVEHDNVVANPEFRDREKRDYRLAARSPCLRLLGFDPVATYGLAPLD